MRPALIIALLVAAIAILWVHPWGPRQGTPLAVYVAEKLLAANSTPTPAGTGAAFSQAQQSGLTWQECDRAITITDRARRIHAAYRDTLKTGPDSMKSYPVRDVSYRTALDWEVAWTGDYNFLVQLLLRLCADLPTTIRAPAER